MIYSFSFKNFCSFSNKATISFENIREGIETGSSMFMTTPLGTPLNKVMILIGPNASGKTNALKALAFLRWFVINSFSGIEKEDVEIPIDTFIFSDNPEAVSEFELVFEHNKSVYKYILHLCKTHVVNEELHRKEETGHFNYLFKRIGNPKSGNFDIYHQQIDIKAEVLKDILRKNVSLVSTSVAIKNDALSNIAEYFKTITSNVNRGGKYWDTFSLGDRWLFEATKAYKEDEKLFEKVKEFLRGIDIGLDGVDIKEAETQAKNGEIRKIPIPYGLHKVKEKLYNLQFAFESSGTKNMFALLHFLLPAIEQGGTAVIDELELDLHPHALPKIIELFANPTINPKNSQLIFTSHSLEILNHLEKEQIVLVEKGKDCKSELYRLDELKGIRREDNFYAKYLAGAYGAVPDI